MESLQQIERQFSIEEQYNRKLIDKKIRKVIQDSPEIQAKVDEGVALVAQYINQDYYESKNARVAQLQGMDLRALVEDLFIGVAYCLREELFTSVTALLAGRLGFSEKVSAIQTVAELLAVLCETDVFDIQKASKQASLMLISRIQLPEDLISFIENSAYLPPMVVKPLELKNNYSNGHLTYNDSLILRSGNHHDGDICLDVLNIVNSVPLRLDTQFLCCLEEHPTWVLKTEEEFLEWRAKKNLFAKYPTYRHYTDTMEDTWLRFKTQSYKFYLLMTQYGNQFYLTNKVDKRGRIYASGYHISTQGTAFKKATIELYKEELVTGVP